MRYGASRCGWVTHTCRPERLGSRCRFQNAGRFGNFLNNALDAICWSGVLPWVFVTDGLKDFIKPVKNILGCGNDLVHVSEIHAQNEFNHNNIQESLNGNIKPLLRRRGGFKVQNSVLVTMAILGYNFFRPHMALDGKTPAEAAGIFIQGDDKVLTLLKAAAA